MFIFFPKAQKVHEALVSMTQNLRNVVIKSVDILVFKE